MDKARIGAPDNEGGENAADHGHQGIDSYQTGNAFQRLRADHVKAKPANAQKPAAQCQPGIEEGGNAVRDHHSVRCERLA